MRRLKKILIIAGVVYLGVVLVFVWLETTLMYPAPAMSQGDWNPGWLEFEEANFVTKHGNAVHGWYCEHPNPRAVVLLFHGNATDVASSAEELDFIRQRFAVSVMAFDYRGYGKSEGKPFQAGILADGLAAQEWLASQAGVSPESIVMWGRSIGGAVAVHTASVGGARGLILDRTFNSMVDVAATHYPWLPVRMFLSNRYPADQWIADYSGPLFQVHGRPDGVVPFQFGRRLFEASPSQQKQFVESPVLTHNAPWPDAYFGQVDEFLDTL